MAKRQDPLAAVRTIAALFVERNGVYSNLDGVDLWPADRDARTYAGKFPVVAHPPCNLWTKFAFVNYKRWGGEHNKPGNDRGCFKSALDNVMRCGGVLEHPAFSYAWQEYGLKRPQKDLGWLRDEALGGYVCEVWQSAYGHLARKRTWLFYCGMEPFDLRWDQWPGTHQIGFHDRRGKHRNKPTISGKLASATPIDFRNDLLKLARGS